MNAQKSINVNPDTLPPLVEPEILVSYEAWIESKSQLYPNEYLYEDDELEEYDKEDGMWQVEIYARLKADNGQYFTTEELLFKLHNLMANKELGDHVFFENLAYDDHEFDADDADDVLMMMKVLLYLSYGLVASKQLFLL